MLTEIEAKMRWCPMDIASGQVCHGSECMAWRLGQPYVVILEEVTLNAGEKPDGWEVKDVLVPGQYPSTPRWESERTVTSAITRWKKTQWLQDKGYCGLAAAPL